jgi:hypothetical protein
MDPALYFAPTFFSPYYFAPLAPPAGQGGGGTFQGPALYFAPTFFSPYYFPPLAPWAGQAGVPGPAGYRDRDAFDAIVSALASTGEFADVLYGYPPDLGVVSAGAAPSAIVTPERWAEYDDVDPTVIVRQVSFTITLLVRDEDAGRRYDDLDRLSSVVANVLDGSSLNGGCMPALTMIREGQFDASSRHPEQRLRLRGEFSYLVPSFTSHTTQ